MSFFTDFFSGQNANIWTISFALIIVLVLIVLIVWFLKLIMNASGTVARGRQRRLAVVDTIAIDTKRHLILVRRDNVEHLIMTGASQDLVIEGAIPVEPEPIVSPRTSVADDNRRTESAAQKVTSSASRLGLTGLLRRRNKSDRSAPPPSAPTTKSQPSANVDPATSSDNHQVSQSSSDKSSALRSVDTQMQSLLAESDDLPERPQESEASVDAQSEAASEITETEVKAVEKNSATAADIFTEVENDTTRTAPSLRHTGLLRTTSPAESGSARSTAEEVDQIVENSTASDPKGTESREPAPRATERTRNRAPARQINAIQSLVADNNSGEPANDKDAQETARQTEQASTSGDADNAPEPKATDSEPSISATSPRARLTSFGKTVSKKSADLSQLSDKIAQDLGKLSEQSGKIVGQESGATAKASDELPDDADAPGVSSGQSRAKT